MQASVTEMKEIAMERISQWLAWAAAVASLVFAGLNWSVLSAPAPMNLLVAHIDAPVGVILLGMTAALVSLFLVAMLYSRIGGLLESRRLLKELQQARDLAERAEASRLGALHQLITDEFRSVNDKLTQIEHGSRSQTLARLA
jgi:uncharacterized integral membrane protein